jgi:hypothetical protein
MADNNPNKNNSTGTPVDPKKESTQPDPNNPAGTSRQPHSDVQENNQQLNPDTENAAGNAAAPGVTPTNKVDKPAEASAPSDAIAGSEPRPHAANPEDSLPRKEYTLQKGKHRYRDPRTGERVTAKEGDTVSLTDKEFASFSDRFVEKR